MDLTQTHPHLIVVLPNGCHHWIGTQTQGGYGRVSVAPGRTELTHRVACRNLKPGMQVDHLCRNRACCNPDHLEAVTQQTNIDRGLAAKGKVRRTHCKRGHELTPCNTYPGRRCRTCVLVRAKTRRK